MGAFQEACGEAQQRATLDYLGFLTALSCVASQMGTSLQSLLLVNSPAGRNKVSTEQVG